jgi:hypothetical protein
VFNKYRNLIKTIMKTVYQVVLDPETFSAKVAEPLLAMMIAVQRFAQDPENPDNTTVLKGMATFVQQIQDGLMLDVVKQIQEQDALIKRERTRLAPSDEAKSFHKLLEDMLGSTVLHPEHLLDKDKNILLSLRHSVYKALGQGCLDLKDYDKDYIPVRVLLAAAFRHEEWLHKPMGKEHKKDVENAYTFM